MFFVSNRLHRVIKLLCETNHVLLVSSQKLMYGQLMYGHASELTMTPFNMSCASVLLEDLNASMYPFVPHQTDSVVFSRPLKLIILV